MSRNLLILLLLLPALSGCLRLARETPERDFYGVEAARTAAPAETPLFGAVRVHRFDVVSRGGDRFVYRQDALRYEEDFYNRFFSPPGVLVAEEVRRWLDGSGLFREVLSGPGRIVPDYLVEGRILEIYGDFRESPRAVLALEVTLLHDAEARSRILLRRTYRSASPLSEVSPGALARGWSRALEEILTTLEADLKGVSPPESAASGRVDKSALRQIYTKKKSAIASTLNYHRDGTGPVPEIERF